MANIPVKPDKGVVVSGKLHSPRYVFVMDRVGADLVANPVEFGIKEDDQLVVFKSGTFPEIQTYMESRQLDYSHSAAIIY